MTELNDDLKAPRRYLETNSPCLHNCQWYESKGCYFCSSCHEQLVNIKNGKYALKDDPIDHPKHYTQHPSGIECIQITEHMNFNLGNALKYIWRADLKNGLEDLKKAAWYVNREIELRSK